MQYLIQFTDPKSGVKCWAGMAGDTYGFAPTPATAIRFDSKEHAERIKHAAYSKSMAEIGAAVPAPEK
jgi:hypothetical protein